MTWRLCRCGLETTLETWRLGSGDDVGDFADVDWKRPWRLRLCEVEMTSEAWQMLSGDDVGDVAPGEWR